MSLTFAVRPEHLETDFDQSIWKINLFCILGQPVAHNGVYKSYYEREITHIPILALVLWSWLHYYLLN